MSQKRTRITAEVVVYRIEERWNEETQEWEEDDIDVGGEDIFAEAIAGTPQEEVLLEIADDVYDFGLNKAEVLPKLPTGQ